MHDQEDHPDLDNCPRCRFRHMFSTQADWELAMRTMNSLLDVGGCPPIPIVRLAAIDHAIEIQLAKRSVPASPDVAAAQAAARESGGQS